MGWISAVIVEGFSSGDWEPGLAIWGFEISCRRCWGLLFCVTEYHIFEAAVPSKEAARGQPPANPCFMM